MFSGFDLSSIVEAGNKLKEEVESNIKQWEPKNGEDSSSSTTEKPESSSSSSSDNEDAGQRR